MQPRDLQRIEHILEYCERIEESVSRFGNDYEIFYPGICGNIRAYVLKSHN